MGMFDNITVRYPLPLPQYQTLQFQTKDTPHGLSLDNYEIREDGTLWHEDYDVEDRSEAGKWLKEHPEAKELPEDMGLLSFSGCLTRVNTRWEQVKNFTGEICFYTSIQTPPPTISGAELFVTLRGWVEFSAYFRDGRIALPIAVIEHTPIP